LQKGLILIVGNVHLRRMQKADGSQQMCRLAWQKMVQEP
jgi:hypothetical protein